MAKDQKEQLNLSEEQITEIFAELLVIQGDLKELKESLAPVINLARHQIGIINSQEQARRDQENVIKKAAIEDYKKSVEEPEGEK